MKTILLILLGTLGPLASAQACLPNSVSHIDLTTAGLTLNGVVDNSNDILKAFDCVKDGGTIKFPAGIVKLSEPIRILNKSLTVKGAGMASTVLRWTTNAGGLSSTDNRTQASQKSTLQIEDLTLETSSQGGVALSAITQHEARSKPSILMSNVTIRPVPGSGGYWSKSFYGQNAKFGRISNVFFRGAGNEDQTALHTSHHIHLEGNSTNFVITGVHGMLSEYGLLVSGESEGILISNSFFVKNTFGIVLRSQGEPMFQIQNSHAASGRHAVWIENGRAAKVTGHFILRQEYAGQQAGMRSIIKISGARSIDVAIREATLTLNDHSDPNVAAIQITNGRRIRVQGCTLRAVEPHPIGTGIVVGAEVGSARLKDNFYVNLTTDLRIAPAAAAGVEKD